ncbi:MAG: uroporphyrinogen decarboxylase family protein [Synergistaceae bacterium]|jgi:uroporphyrinogen decarboxylase|nr:uroporphyrinogen decarboxylase family protein [Synergistaceae bacterium]
MMGSRERTFMALAHVEPDRPPVSATFTPEAAEMLRAEYGRRDEDLGYVMGNDLIKTAVGVENSYYMRKDAEYVCPFGIKWRNVFNETGHYTEVTGGALYDDPDGDKLRAWDIPDPDDPALYESVRQVVGKYGERKFIIGSCQCSIFEASWYVHGMEQTLMDMADDEDYANELFDKMMRFPLRAGLNMIDAGVDMVWLGDDVATQLDMMISVPMWRKFFKDRYATLFSEFREKRPDIVIAYHSCGNCEKIVDDMVEIGLDALNPIQPLAMDPFKMKKRYGKKLTLFGGVDVQWLLPLGTPEEISEAVRKNKEVIGDGGGYILAPAHHIQSDTSLENVKAFYSEALMPMACHEYVYQI